MKPRIIFGLLGILFLAGCGDSMDRFKCEQNVSQSVPDAETVRALPRDWTYLVRKKDGSIWYMETGNLTDAKVSRIEKIMDGPGTAPAK